MASQNLSQSKGYCIHEPFKISNCPTSARIFGLEVKEVKRLVTVYGNVQLSYKNVCPKIPKIWAIAMPFIWLDIFQSESLYFYTSLFLENDLSHMTTNHFIR